MVSMREHGHARARRRCAVMACAATVLAASLASCAGSSAQPDPPSRTATKELASSGWDLEFHVVLTNATRRPVEVAVASAPGEGSLQVSTDPPSAKTSVGTIVVPASPDAESAALVDVFVQAKPGGDRLRVLRQSTSIPPDDEAPTHLRLVTPTVQLGFDAYYEWQAYGGCDRDNIGLTNRLTGERRRCDVERRTLVKITTMDHDGFQVPIESALTCLDPTRLPKFGSQIGDPTKPVNARYAARSLLDPNDASPTLDRVEVSFRSPAAIAEDLDTERCANEPPVPGTALAGGFALSTPTVQDPLPRLVRHKMPRAVLPGIDLSGTNLNDVDFTGDVGANLSHADLSDTKLARARLDKAILIDADLEGADLTDAVLSEAVLFGVDLTTTTGKPKLWNGIKVCRTKLPDYMRDGAGKVIRPDRDCNLGLASAVGAQPGYDAALVDTGSERPLVLTAFSDPDCAAMAAVGSYQPLRLPACGASYASALLPGGPGGLSYTMPGRPDYRTGYGTILFQLTPLRGWELAVCLKSMGEPAADGTGPACPDRYRPRT